MFPIAVFAKPPLPGQVKTRLIPDIGANKAARVYRYCLAHALEVTRHSGLDYRVFLSKQCDDGFLSGEPYAIQRGADLGERMLNAIADLLGDNVDGAIVIGTDCLDLEAGHLQRAALALADHDLVLLPAIDGGYALIGCRYANPDLFSNVTWSSEQVLEQTLANAESLNYRAILLETVRDIDTLHDLEQYPELLRLIASP